MALRRITMCEQAGTGLRMIRDEWKKLGHPVPVCKNDRSVKAFEFFLPDGMDELKKPYKKPYKSPYKSPTQLNIPEAVHRLLVALATDERTSASLQEELGLKHRATFQENYIRPALDLGLIEYTIPDKPNSRLQKYRLTEKGQEVILDINTPE